MYLDFSKDAAKLAGSSLYQALNKVGQEPPSVVDAAYFANAFETVQQLISQGLVLAGHDISSGCILTALLEMCFPSQSAGIKVDVAQLDEKDLVKAFFSENPGILIQVEANGEVENLLAAAQIEFKTLVTVTLTSKI